jgi:hypothetical protein
MLHVSIDLSKDDILVSSLSMAASSNIADLLLENLGPM